LFGCHSQEKQTGFLKKPEYPLSEVCLLVSGSSFQKLPWEATLNLLCAQK